MAQLNVMNVILRYFINIPTNRSFFRVFILLVWFFYMFISIQNRYRTFRQRSRMPSILKLRGHLAMVLQEYWNVSFDQTEFKKKPLKGWQRGNAYAAPLMLHTAAIFTLNEAHLFCSLAPVSSINNPNLELMIKYGYMLLKWSKDNIKVLKILIIRASWLTRLCFQT